MPVSVAKVIKPLVRKQGLCTDHFVFNDRLKDGPKGQQRRSLKVQGWVKGDYTDAKRLLEAAGWKVELVEFPAGEYTQAAREFNMRMQYRLRLEA